MILYKVQDESYFFIHKRNIQNKSYHEQMRCPRCKNVDYPLMKENRISNIMMPAGIGGDEARTKRNYFLICPHCQYIITTK